MSAPASLPFEIFRSAERGELQKVVKWLRKGGQVGALCPVTVDGGRTTNATLLHAASGYGHLAMVRELLKRGASVNLQSSLGGTALMEAAFYGHPSIVLVLLRGAPGVGGQCVSVCLPGMSWLRAAFYNILPVSMKSQSISHHGHTRHATYVPDTSGCPFPDARDTKAHGCSSPWW